MSTTPDVVDLHAVPVPAAVIDPTAWYDARRAILTIPTGAPDDVVEAATLRATFLFDIAYGRIEAPSDDVASDAPAPHGPFAHACAPFAEATTIPDPAGRVLVVAYCHCGAELSARTDHVL